MEKKITEEELKIICDEAKEEFLITLQSDLTLSEKQERALITLLSVIRQKLEIPKYYPLPPKNQENISQTQSIYNEILRLLLDKEIFQPWLYVEEYMKSIFGEKDADFGAIK